MLYEDDDDYENDDVRTVFEAREAQLKKEHDESLAAMWRDLMRIDHIQSYVPRQWDVSQLPEEARGTIPKEPDYVEPTE